MAQSRKGGRRHAKLVPLRLQGGSRTGLKMRFSCALPHRKRSASQKPQTPCECNRLHCGIKARYTAAFGGRSEYGPLQIGWPEERKISVFRLRRFNCSFSERLRSRRLLGCFAASAPRHRGRREPWFCPLIDVLSFRTWRKTPLADLKRGCSRQFVRAA